MKTTRNLWLPSLLLAASAVVSSYIVAIMGFVVHQFYAVAYGRANPDVVEILIPPMTKLVILHSWAFITISALTSLSAIILLCRYPLRVLQVLILGLCSQALLFWGAMFCCCYDGFTGNFSMHHVAYFQFSEFFQFAYGIFPVTLCAALIPALATVISLAPQMQPKLANRP